MVIFVGTSFGSADVHFFLLLAELNLLKKGDGFMQEVVFFFSDL
jgi:hypothetical protein